MKRRVLLLLLVSLILSPLWGITANASDKIRITLVGDNEAEESKVIEISVGDTFTVPECEFEEPEGLIFGRWSIGGEPLFPGEVLELTEDTEIHAYWVEPLTINVDVYCGETKGIGGIVSFPADTNEKESNKGLF